MGKTADIGITYHEKFCQYDLGAGHPFRGDRFKNVKRFLEKEDILNSPNVKILRPKPAKKEDLLMIHEKGYVDLIFNLAERGEPYDIETPTSPTILEATLLIVGGGILCIREICEDRLQRAISIGGGFHHAGKDYGGGFCLFNDVAITAEYAKRKYNVKRILILDYDVHFGNGTSDIFYEDPSTLLISIHQDPRTIYPGIGFIEQIGKGLGEGYNINVPLPPGTSDETYLYVLRGIFAPLAKEFKPEIIIANGGSDPHFADSLGGLALTINGFHQISKLITKVAEDICHGKLILMVGSGYNPIVLPNCWYALIAGAIGLERIKIKEPYPCPPEPPQCRDKVKRTLEELKHILSRYWRCFS